MRVCYYVNIVNISINLISFVVVVMVTILRAHLLQLLSDSLTRRTLTGITQGEVV